MIDVHTIALRLNFRMAGVVTSAFLMVAGLSGLGATTASAQTAAPGQMAATGQTAAPQDTPAVLEATLVNGRPSCPVGGWLVEIYRSSFGWCFYALGSYAQVNGTGPFDSLRIRVVNRVWLHQHADGSGWGDCFETQNPPSTFGLSGRDRNPGNLQIALNTAPC